MRGTRLRRRRTRLAGERVDTVYRIAAYEPSDLGHYIGYRRRKVRGTLRIHQ